MSPSSEETLSHQADPSRSAAHEVLFIRWVLPRPSAGVTWLDPSRLVLGRDEGADVCMASREVSRRHAEVIRSGPLWIVNDLESKNGMFVNGKRGKSAALASGDVLRLGDFLGVVGSATRETDVSFSALGSGIYGAHVHRALLRRVAQLARLAFPVVLEGETGTGKELFARELHAASGRSGPFLAVNAAVYPQSVAPAELFGYRGGAFTDKERSSPGHLRAADGGTLLLDELAELAPDVQPMLLRAIETREVLPLGESRPVPIDVRFVSATQEPLAKAVQRGRFRADLRARVEGAVIALPALRECRDIVPDLLGVRFAAHAGLHPSLSLAAMEKLCLHDWPMNIRELDTLARRLALRAAERVIDGHELEMELSQMARPERGASERADAEPIPGRRAPEDVYDAAELEQLLAALARHAGNVTKAAAELGVTRQKAYRMLKAAGRTP